MKINNIIFILTVCFLPGIVSANNLSFLKDSAVSYFTDKDTDLMWGNTMNTLDHYSDGKKSFWKNSQSGAWGYAIPSDTTKIKGTTCRHIKIFNESHHRTGESNYTFCKINGKWKIPD